ncbi:MAG TPA: WD40 repeat domain-containing protein, partial [Thermoanaerobaculia bacterium]|nr:WD40 repeat domain-containing protein [Thermoanaerobaculia bacterium]
RGGGHVVTVQGGVATLWDTASGRRVGPGPNLSGVVRTVRFAPDGHLLLTAGTGGVAHLWDPASGRHQGDLADGEEWSLNCVEPSPNDRRVVICSQGGYAQVFDAASRQPLGEPMRTEVAVTQAEWSADNERVLTISSDCTVQVWDAASGAAVSERIYPGFPCRRAHFSPDGQRVVTGSAPEGKVLIRLWEAGSGSQIGHDLSFQGNLTDLTFSPDGQRLLLIQEQARPSLWDMATGKSGDAELLTLMAEVAGGNEVNEQGHVLAVTELSGRWDRLLHGITGQGVGAAVAKWLVADPRSEMVSPLSSPRPKGSTPVPGATATATSNR